MKLEFAQMNLVESLLNIADKFAKPSQPQASFDQEFDASKVATDIIVLLLTGGMYICYTCNMQRLLCSGRYYAINISFK